MSDDSSLLENSIESIRDSVSTHSREAEDLAANVRWMSTLILAEIAGIAYYRNLQAEHSLSLMFALAVLVLAFSLLVFLVAVWYSKLKKSRLELSFHISVRKLRGIFEDKDKTKNQGNAEILKLKDSDLSGHTEALKWPRVFELIGIALFVLASILATLGLFWSELTAIF